MSIIINKISKQFDSKVVLNNIELSVNPGEIFGLLGPSGAGKTTLIKILTSQLKANSGTASILNCNVDKLTEDIYTNIGIVYENSGLYDRLSCFDNLKIFAKIYGIEKESIMNILGKVGLDECANRPVQKLSTGMKRRLVIARAIMHKPKLLFLDEPTSGLDPVSADKIHKIILEFKSNGTNIFLTTHNMNEATKLCDNIALLHKGQIIEYGKPSNVCYKYNDKKQAELIYNGKAEIVSLEKLSIRLTELNKEKIEIDAIHSLEPNLEDVFIKLTGKALVD